MKINQKIRNILKKNILLLNKTQDEKTGFLDLGKPSSLHNQMAGAYHFFIFYYTYLKKKPRLFRNK